MTQNSVNQQKFALLRVANGLSLERTGEATAHHVETSSHWIPKAITLIASS
jgi:hypothetical protein